MTNARSTPFWERTLTARYGLAFSPTPAPPQDTPGTDDRAERTDPTTGDQYFVIVATDTAHRLLLVDASVKGPPTQQALDFLHTCARLSYTDAQPDATVRWLDRQWNAEQSVATLATFGPTTHSLVNFETVGTARIILSCSPHLFLFSLSGTVLPTAPTP